MALIRHIYGRPIVFRYIPIAGDEEFVADSLISARLYGPNGYPSDAQIADSGQASTGHIGSRVTEWELVNEEGTGPAEYRIVFPPISDAQPDSRSEYDLFYVALNFLAEATGEPLRDVEQIQVFRADGLTSKIRVRAEDVWSLESKLEGLDPNPPLWTEEKIEAAIEEILSRLEGRAYAKARLFNLEKLNGAARRLACSYGCFDLISQGTEWAEKAAFWREQSDVLLDIAKIGYDQGAADTPAPEEKVNTGAVIIAK
ncbi:hypothetical protein EP7_004334 [Isosphaeraceae bacterium EP7]